jgi:hypothetical protein
VTRGSPFARSPVPMASAYPHHTRAQFAQLPGESLKPETRWRGEVNSNCRCRLEKGPFVKPRSVDWALAQFGELAGLIRPTSKLSTH